MEIATPGEVFSDGSAIELLRDPGCPEQLNLVLWRDGVLDTKTELPYANRVFALPPVDPSLVRAIRFPTRIAKPESTKELFNDVHAVLGLHLGQLDSVTTSLVFAIFASWLSPVLPTAPVLSIFAPAGSPKNLTLKMLNLLVRRPLRLAGVKRGELLRLPMELRPTLLLDEPEINPAMQDVLQAGAHRDVYVPRGNGVRDLFGPKIILSGKSLEAVSLETGALRAALIPVSGPLQPLDKKTEEEIAGDFQSRFLGFFLRNFSSLQIPTFDVSGFAQPVQTLARTLGAAVVGDVELQARILPLLKIQDEESRADHARSCDAVVLEALLSFIHQNGWSRVHTGNIAEKVAAIYNGRGDDHAPSPETVGWAIRRLGIPSGRINRAGNGVELNVATRRLIHRLAMSHGVRAMDGTLRDDCRFCCELKPIAQATSRARAEDAGVAEDF